MRKIISIFIIIMIIGTMFAGCDTKEAVTEEAEGFVNEIITENVIVEETIVEDIIVEDVWISPEYKAESEFNSLENDF